MAASVGTIAFEHRSIRVTHEHLQVATARQHLVLQSRELDERGRRYFLIEQEVGDGEVLILDELWDDTAAGVLPMDFTPLGEATVQVKFVENTLETVHRNGARNIIRAHIREELS